MKKRKPKLAVDNSFVEGDELSYEEFKFYAEKILDLRQRYPELVALSKRARDNDDIAMTLTLAALDAAYEYWRDIIAAKQRAKLKATDK